MKKIETTNKFAALLNPSLAFVPNTRNHEEAPGTHGPNREKTHENPCKIAETLENIKTPPSPPPAPNPTQPACSFETKTGDPFQRQDRKHFNPNPSPLASLTAEQREQLAAWIESGEPLTQIAERVGQNPPDGFALKTYPTTLRRFYARHRAAAQRDNLFLASSLPDPAADAPLLDQATVSSMRHLAFELAQAPCPGAKNFRALTRWVLRLRDQDRQNKLLELARSRLEFEREKFRTDVARIVLKNHEKIAGIKREILSDHEMSERARQLVIQRLEEMIRSDAEIDGQMSEKMFRAIAAASNENPPRLP